MTHQEPLNDTVECLFATICGCVLPFFLSAADGNQNIARAAVIELVNAYNASTATELDLVGRVVGFSIVAMDNLRLSMDDSLSDTKILRYRSNAVALSRASERALQILQVVQQKRESTRPIPRPAVVAAPNPPAHNPATDAPKREQPRAAAPAMPVNANIAKAPAADIDAMKREARIMMDAFSKHGGLSSTAIGVIPTPDTFTRPIEIARRA